MTSAAAIGFRAKTGRAIAVALAGSPRVPELLWRREVALVDPEVPETSQPFHEVMDLPWEQSLEGVKPWVGRIEAVARAAVASMVREVAGQGWKVVAIGVVGSPDRALHKLGNFHIRAHAAEGILFRRVLEGAATHQHLGCVGFSEKEVGPTANATLGGVANVAGHLKVLGRQAGAPWRLDERAAAMAAWLALAGRGRADR